MLPVRKCYIVSISENKFLKNAFMSIWLTWGYSGEGGGDSVLIFL